MTAATRTKLDVKRHHFRACDWFHHYGSTTDVPIRYSVTSSHNHKMVFIFQLAGTGVKLSLGYPLDTDTAGFAQENLNKVPTASHAGLKPSWRWYYQTCLYCNVWYFLLSPFQWSKAGLVINLWSCSRLKQRQLQEQQEGQSTHLIRYSSRASSSLHKTYRGALVHTICKYSSMDSQ